MTIAIDGPSGAGKSTLSRTLAERFGFSYIDTGALYRAVALFSLRNGVAPGDENAVRPLLETIDLGVFWENGEQHVTLSGEDVSGLIRTGELSEGASRISALASVRAFLLDFQRELAENNNVIMDGRDIGTVVFPNAELKIFLTASVEDRARRRWEELNARGQLVELEAVLTDMSARDERDSARALAPLRPADDAVIVDTSGNTFERSLEVLGDIIKCSLER